MLIKKLLTFASAVALTACVSQGTYDREHELNEELQTKVSSDQVQIQELKDRLRVTVEDQTLYPSGSADLSKSGKGILDKIVPTLKDATDYRIEVEGFTDDRPIGKGLQGKYKSNWELSAARAAVVVEYLQKKGIDPSRMTLSGHGQYAPSGDNKTAEGRAQNRHTNIDLIKVDNNNDQKSGNTAQK